MEDVGRAKFGLQTVVVGKSGVPDLQKNALVAIDSPDGAWNGGVRCGTWCQTRRNGTREGGLEAGNLRIGIDRLKQVLRVISNIAYFEDSIFRDFSLHPKRPGVNPIWTKS